MRKTLLAFGIALLFLPGCSKNINNSAASVVKPKYHHRWYDRKKDKHTKRTKIVRMR
jgi:hypothetical protein